MVEPAAGYVYFLVYIAVKKVETEYLGCMTRLTAVLANIES